MSKITLPILKPIIVAISASLFSLTSVNIAYAYQSKCPGSTVAACSSCHAGTPAAGNGSCPAGGGNR